MTPIKEHNSFGRVLSIPQEVLRLHTLSTLAANQLLPAEFKNGSVILLSSSPSPKPSAEPQGKILRWKKVAQAVTWAGRAERKTVQSFP